MTKIAERLDMEKVAEIMEMKQDIVSTLNDVEVIMTKEKAIALNKENKIQEGGMNMNLQLLAAKKPEDADNKKERADINVTPKSAKTPYMRAINKAIMENRYNINFIVDRINLVIGKDRTIKSQRFCRSVEGTVPMFKYFDVDTQAVSWVAESYNDKGYVKDTQVYKTGIKNMPIGSVTVPAYDDSEGWTKYRKITGDLLVIQFKGFVNDAVEEYAGKYCGKGFYVGIAEDGSKELFETKEELLNSGLEIDGAYRMHFNSTSTLKSGTVFFSKLNCSIDDFEEENDVFARARKEREDQLDLITKGALKHGLKKLESKRLWSMKKDTEARIPSDYSKLMVRPGLVATTPLIKLGAIKNIFRIDCDIETPDEFENEIDKVKEIMKEFGIDNNFSDGAFVLSVKLIKTIMKERFDLDLTTAQVESLGLQVRGNLITLKGFARVYNSNMILVKTIALLEDYANKIIVYCEDSDNYKNKGIKHKYSGQELLNMLNSEDDMENKVAKYILSNIDLVATKNEMKLINDEELDKEDAEAEIFLVNAPNETESETSNQQLNKIVLDYKEDTVNMMRILTGEKSDKISEIGSTIRFNKECKGIENRPVDTTFNILGEDEAKKDKALMINRYSNDIKSCQSSIGRARVETGASYLTLVPNDIYLGRYVEDNKIKFAEILGSRIVEHFSPIQIAKKSKKGSKIKCIEVYSKTVNEKIAILIEELRENSYYSEEELKRIEISLRVYVMLKYPTQGVNEYVFVYCVSNEEISDRLSDLEDKLPEANINALNRFYFRNPYSCCIVAADNSLKNQCAGFDFDGDECMLVPHELRDVNGSTVYGLIDPETKEVVDDYTSILVKKYIKDGSKYTCTCICYNTPNRPIYEDVPVKIDTTKTRKASNIKSATSNSIVKVNNSKLEKAEKLLGSNKFKADANRFLGMPYLPNYGGETQDILGLYSACNKVGDNIGMTIVLCSVVIMASLDVMFDKEGKFNYDLFEFMFEPLGVGELKYTRPYETVFSMDPNEEGEITKIEVKNRFGINRIYYKVTDNVIKQFCYNVRAMGEDTTIEEWKTLVNDFNHITRALGESSIDAKKDILKQFCKVATKIVNRGIRCLGNIKNEYIENNYKDMYSSETCNNRFDFDFGPKFVNSSRFFVIKDSIGEIKKMQADIYADMIEETRQDIIDEATYEFYTRYMKDNEDDQLLNVYSNTAEAIHKILKYVLVSNIPNNDSVVNALSKEEKAEVLNGIYNLAALEGCKAKDVIKLAIEDAFFKDGEFNFGMHYSSKLNTVMNFFKEAFIIERTDSETIPVSLRINIDSSEIENNKEYLFDTGVCLTDEDIKIDDLYTGYAIAKDDELIVDFDPMINILADDEIFSFTVSAFAKEIGVEPTASDFKAELLDKEYLDSFGYKVLDSGEELTFDTFIEDEEKVFVLRDINGNAVATLNQTADSDGLLSLVGKKFIGYTFLGYSNEFESNSGSRRKNNLKKERRAYMNYFINGTVK